MVKQGHRIRLVRTEDKYAKLEPGEEGIVTKVEKVGDYEMIDVDWDCGSGLALIEGKDEYRIVY
jgi:hypothetical protein